jgi:hypothetical protein
VQVFKSGSRWLTAAALFSLCACDGGAVPSNSGAGTLQAASDVRATDTTSILKQLKKNVVIGSTIDPKNGDRGPFGIAVVQGKKTLQKGQLLVCNIENAKSEPGNGTTIELLDSKPGSNPATFARSAALAGCDGITIDSLNTVFATAYTAKDLAILTSKGAVKKQYSGHYIHVPFGNIFAMQGRHYQAAYDFIADVSTGSILSLSYDRYGSEKVQQVATGFAVNQKGPLATLGPSGLQYDKKLDILYIVDGVDNTVVEFTRASDLLVKNEIVVEPGGKTFKCKYRKVTCGKLIYSGDPLDAPMAATLLPNGNLIVANAKGGNALVELTPAGQILDTKIVDKNKTAGVFGLAAIGTSDSDTNIYYTDTNTNDVEELER